jgi:hypothetical protein
MIDLNEITNRLESGTFLKDIRESEKSNVKITIECTEAAAKESLLPLLDYMKTIGNPGHSFSIIVDDKKFSFDGNGTDRIVSIKLNEEEYKE